MKSQVLNTTNCTHSGTITPWSHRPPPSPTHSHCCYHHTFCASVWTQQVRLSPNPGCICGRMSLAHMAMEEGRFTMVVAFLWVSLLGLKHCRQSKCSRSWRATKTRQSRIQNTPAGFLIAVNTFAMNSCVLLFRVCSVDANSSLGIQECALGCGPSHHTSRAR